MSVSEMPSVEVAGLSVTGFPSLERCAEHLLTVAHAGIGAAAFAVNAEKIVSCMEDPALGSVLRQATLRYPDGAGVVLAMRRKGVVSARVAGADLWLSLIRYASSESLKIALIGARPDVIEETQQRLESDFVGVRVVMAVDGYEGAANVPALAESLIATDPNLVFVAMGSPRQEELILELRRHYPAGLYMGLGGSFDVYCGRKRRAPLWMQRFGLEWMFRFLAEPSRVRRERKRIKFLVLLLSGRL